MGKRLLSKYSDINHHVKKRTKKEKTKTERTSPKVKRKSSTQIEEPPDKIQKKSSTNEELDEFLYKEKQEEFSKNLICTQWLPQSENVVLNTKERAYHDVFFSEELLHTRANLLNKDFYFHIIDEISLEGLDGITIEAFWKRFDVVLEDLPHIINPIKNFIWQNVINPSNRFNMYELPEARKNLEIYNRYDYTSTEIGVVMELAYDLPDIYPPKPVHGASVLGSCAMFKERRDITKEIKKLTINEAEKSYGNKLVIVADQNLRTYSLCGDLIDAAIEFLNTEYTILEKVGRSRKLGELTQGRMSVGTGMNLDARTIFHYKKLLRSYDLISTQFFFIKSPLLDYNKTGSLMHLKRFYTNIRSYQCLRAGEVISLLKSQPGYKMECKKLKQAFGDRRDKLGKLVKKSPELKKFVKFSVCPYRQVYPNATYEEYSNKNGTEKLLNFYELINPYVNIFAYWRALDNEEPDDEEEKEEEASGQLIYNMDTLRNAYYRVYSKGEKGCTAAELRAITGFNTNTVRHALKKLDAKGIVTCSKVDMGKTRKYVYVARNLTDPDELLDTVKTDRDKPKISAVKARILERQRLALEKKKQENVTDKNETKEHVDKNDKFLRIEKPNISGCKFLVRDFEVIFESKHLGSIFDENINLRKTYTVDLTFLGLNTNQTFEIGKFLDEISPNVSIPSVKNNFNAVYVKKHSSECLEMTILLIKATLGEINIKNEILDTKPKQDLPDLTVPNIKKIEFMGENPAVEFFESDRLVTIEITSSTVPEKYNFDKVYVTTDQLTERVLLRIQTIIDLVNELKIIQETSKLVNLVVDIETKNGYHKRLDRKSLFRIVSRLVKEGYIRVFKLFLYNETINKTVLFICHPSASYMDDTIKTACQQLRWKYFTGSSVKSTKPQVEVIQKKIKDQMEKSPFSQKDVLNSISELHKLGKVQVLGEQLVNNQRMGKIYGAKPKFTRMRIMHEFLFHLVYHYTGFQNAMPLEDVRKLFKSYRIEVSDTDLNEMPDIFSNEISWKTFVPPLPVHTGWPNGWAFVCDIILRLPISILLKIHNCTLEDEELLNIVNHPVKKYFLVKDLPERVRKTVLFKRKYLFSIHDTISRLVICGLAQFGPQKFKEKDLVFVYINRRASLKDTRSSAPGYNEIEKKPYPEMQFYFNTHGDVEKYWQMVNTISLNTKLNSREPGKVVTLTYLNSKHEITQCIKPRTPAEAVLHDDGSLPGDGTGACGLDSSLWCHLIRNWFWSTKGTHSQNAELTNDALKKFSGQIKSFQDLHSKSIPKFYMPQTFKQKPTKKSLKKQRPAKVLVKRHAPKYTRVIQKRAGKLIKRAYNDDVDKKILKKLGIRRAHWVEEEEESVLLCKIGDIIMNGAKKYKKQVVPFVTVRDVLHTMSPISKFKTSRAIQRHWIKMQRVNYIGLEEKVANLFKLKPIQDTIAPLLSVVGAPDEKTSKIIKLTDSELSAAYIFLMSYISHNKRRILDALEGNLVNNDHLSEENIKYTEETVVDVDAKDKKYSDPKSDNDIKKDIVKSVIHSSLCSKSVTNFSNQLLKIYQNYSDSMIKEAVKELKESNLITYRRWKDRKAKIWDTPFSLSQFYVFVQFSTFSSVTSVEAFQAFQKIVKHQGKGIEGTLKSILNKRYGQLLGLSEFYSFYSKPEIIFHWPKNTIILNPEISDHTELVTELALRYQMTLKEGNDIETDFDTESERNREKEVDQELTEDDKEVSQITEQAKITPNDGDDNPLDLTTDSGNLDTISRLKTWVSDCLTADSERRSPSPEFMTKNSEIVNNDTKTVESDAKTEETHDKEEIGAVSMEVDTNRKGVGQIPTLEDIKEAMLKPIINDEERTIPYITELSDLLTKNFTDLKMDNETLARLKSHFIHEYASLDHIVVEDCQDLKNNSMVKFLDDALRNEKMWDRIESDIIIKDFLRLPKYEELIETSGGNSADVALASEIIDFAAKKQFIGATAQEIKEEFLCRELNVPLTNIVRALIEAGILLQTGIVTLTFVHFKYQYIWVVERENIVVNSSSTSDDAAVSKGSTKTVRMKIMPWVRVNGHLDKSILKNWLTNVLSYSLDYPKVTFGKLADKYCYIKPVDLFYLVQILEELGCIKLFIYEKQDQNLFTDWMMPQERAATFLDNLEDIMIQPNNVSMTCLGSFLCFPAEE